MKRTPSGYSLAELLVVVAIIGIVSLVTVPNFISLRRSSMLKTSTRNFAADIRAARQRAVTKHQRTKVSFDTGTTARGYRLFEWNPTTNAWDQIGADRVMEEGCYILSATNFPDRDVPPDATNDIVFKVDGAPLYDPTVFSGTVRVQTEWNLPTKAFDLEMSYAGALKVVPYPPIP